jgi:transcriptional regulator with GAF, ATPase, and Fis domain
MPKEGWHRTWRLLAEASGTLSRMLRQALTGRGLLILAGVSVCVYAVGVLWYAQSLPDLGIRSAFSADVRHVRSSSVHHNEGRLSPEPDDVVEEVAGRKVNNWTDLLLAPLRLREELSASAAGESGPAVRRSGEDWLVKVTFRRKGADGEAQRFSSWMVLGNVPLRELVPSGLWFLLKITLFVIGALVFWKRPNDEAATQFFFLCIVTLGAYMGGYHWWHILTQPVLILGFTVCAVLLPVAFLHFYLVFPRPKQFLQRHPRSTLLAVYALPMFFLVEFAVGYCAIRLRLGDLATTLDVMRISIYVYLGVAALWYLASVVCLVHSRRTALDVTERNQVKWIMWGALAALVPIGYSFFIAVWQPGQFGGGKATWPMFCASVCFTVAFAVSITRYRLMELDQLISSGMIYFLITCLVGVGYYGVVFVGTLVFNQVLAGPPLKEALMASSTALVVLLLIDLARSRVKKALDRRFSREKFQLDHTLQRMGQAIAQLVDPPTLAQRLLSALADLLGVPRGAVYLRDGEPSTYRLSGCLGPPPALTELPPGCPLVEALRGGTVVRWRGEAADRYAVVTPAQRQLRFLGGEVAHGLAHEGNLLALLVLGPRGPVPYRAEDLNLLGAFAQITVLALESAVGHRTIELLNRDLQTKVEKISEQQRRILALQSQLRKQSVVRGLAAVQGGEAAEARPGAADDGPRGGIIGSSPPVRQLLDLVRKVSGSEAAVLIRGESGTGKELLARALHDHSARAGKPFVKVHCAALSQGLLESELFGHVKGAFTGAHRDKVGRFELAHGGTLFLDEIGDINLEVQTKLLRVLQEMMFERVGSSEPVRVDVRVIAATHQDLERLIAEGRFRADLYYRLNVISIPVPPLRERAEDVPELAGYFLRQCAQRSGKAVTQIDDDALAILKGHPWPGNIRQLENAIARAVVVAEEGVITVEELPQELVEAVADGKDAAPHENGKAALELGPGGLEAERDWERERLVRALAAADGNKARAARALGLARSTLLSRLKKHGLS